jgi:hypothetical protein
MNLVKYRFWTQEDWGKVMFSDESTLQSIIYTIVCCIDFMSLIASAGEIIFVFYWSVGGFHLKIVFA